MSEFLEEIADLTRLHVRHQKTQVSIEQLRDLFAVAGAVRPFSAALHPVDGIGLIAELKQASPSAGIIRQETDMEGRLRSYARGGASAISILTEEHYFQGSPGLLQVARKSTSLPLLRKDFIIDGFQIDESRSLGADAILLIVALLSKSQLSEFMAQATAVGLETLVEIHDEQELQTAVQAGAEMLGINNRNLKTLVVDTNTAKHLLPLVPPSVKTVIVESGIRETSEVGELKRLGAHALLIGETLMRQADPETAVRSFREGAG